jgi:hypothetical protein
VSPKRAARRPADLRGPEFKPRRAFAIGAASTLVGIALVGVDSSDVGMVLCVAGVLAMIYAIHTFGRLGPESTPGLK